MTVNELLSRVDSHELSEWVAYAQVEPFGEDRADLRSAIIACTFANMMAAAWGKKGHKGFKITDFLPNFEPPRKQSLKEMENVLRRIAGEPLKP